MPEIRLLQSVVGDGPVAGDAGAVLKVDDKTAKVWADDVRAERVRGTSAPMLTKPEAPKG